MNRLFVAFVLLVLSVANNINANSYQSGNYFIILSFLRIINESNSKEDVKELLDKSCRFKITIRSLV